MFRNIHDHLKYSIWCRPEYEEILDNLIENNNFLIFGLTWCPWTRRAKTLVRENYENDPKILAPDIVSQEYKVNLLYCMCKKTNTTNIPQIWIKGEHIGGFEQLYKMHYRNQIVDMTLKKTDF